MEPRTFELAIDNDGHATAGYGVLAAYIPASDYGPPVCVLACDPRHEPSKPITELAPATMAYVRTQIGEKIALSRWAVIDSIGRFTEAVPTWRTSGNPDVIFERFPGGLSIDAFFRET